MYDKQIDIFDYSFLKHFVVKELGFSDKKNIQIHIILNEGNFDFSKVNLDFGDIRFTENKDGSNCLFYWISYLDYENKKCCVWIELPELNKGENKTIYMFFGSDDAKSRSNINNLNFIFKYNSS